MLFGIKKYSYLILILFSLPSVAISASTEFPSELLPMVKENVGDNIASLNSLKRKVVKWSILDRVPPRTDAIYVFQPAKVSLRVGYDVEEVVFFWGLKEDSSIQYRIMRTPGLTPSPRKQLIEFYSGPESECKSPWHLVMLIRIGVTWYYDAKKVGFLISDCGSN